MQKRVIKVFSKFSTKDIRKWGVKLMQTYQLLHATEKPMNLEYIKPFANTNELIKENKVDRYGKTNPLEIELNPTDMDVEKESKSQTDFKQER